MNNAVELGDFLNNLGYKLLKEGISISAMARELLAETGENEEVFAQIGVDISELGRELLAVKNQLCPNCMSRQLRGRNR